MLGIRNFNFMMILDLGKTLLILIKEAGYRMLVFDRRIVSNMMIPDKSVYP